MIKFLVIDNYDSFTYNLIQMFMNYNLDIKVCRNNKISIKEAVNYTPDYILISPGPKNPKHSGISIDIIKTFYHQVPILGICLGLQCINELFGGLTKKSPHPMHGKTSKIYHNHNSLFKHIPSPFNAARYHSLVSKPNSNSLKNYLKINSWSPNGTIMGLSHKTFPLHGVQFHPESFLTEHGSTLIKNFLKLGLLKNQL